MSKRATVSLRVAGIGKRVNALGKRVSVGERIVVSDRVVRVLGMAA